MRRKRRSPAPAFRQPAPFNPVTGQFAMLGTGVDLTRVALMQVLEEHDDYLICRGFDPETKRFYNEIPVAKPYLLQRTPWDGRTVTLPEETVEYSYTEPDEPEAGEVAVARERTESYSTSGTFTVKIEPPYFVGDILVCVKPRGRLGDSPGLPAGADDGVDELNRVIGIMRTEQDANRLQKVVEWVDLNVGARRWGDSEAAKVVELTENLDAKGTATGKFKRLNAAGTAYEDHPDYPDEITVTELKGQFCGIKGELIEVRSAGTDSGGETIWEVVRGGATWHKVTLSGTLSPDGSQEATVTINGIEATITVQDVWLPSGDEQTGVIGATYSFEDQAWYFTVGAC